jgi:hypothetical protein
MEAAREMAGAEAPAPVADGAPARPSRKHEGKSTLTLTLLQANLLVAMLGGFWARQADGHPGPDLMGRGLLILNALVEWERTKKERARKKAPPKEERRKPG